MRNVIFEKFPKPLSHRGKRRQKGQGTGFRGQTKFIQLSRKKKIFNLGHFLLEMGQNQQSILSNTEYRISANLWMVLSFLVQCGDCKLQEAV